MLGKLLASGLGLDFTYETCQFPLVNSIHLSVYLKLCHLSG